MASSAKDIQLRELKDTVSQLKTMMAEQTELIKALRLIIDEKSSHEKALQEQVDYLTKKLFGVFCKTFLHKIAKTFCRSLQLHFVGNCKPGWQSWYLPAI